MYMPTQKPRESAATEGRGGTAGPPERWSPQRKTEVVLRLLRGEDLGEVSREVQVTASELEEWRRELPFVSPFYAISELLEKRGYGDDLRKLLKRSGD